MKTEFLYQPYKSIAYADRILTVPKNSKWLTNFGIIVEVTMVVPPNTLLLQVSSIADEPPLPRREYQTTEIAKSVVDQILLVEQWKEILVRSQITVTTKQENISAVVNMRNEDIEEQDDDCLCGILNFINMVLIVAIQNMLYCGIKLVDVQQA
jgi:hypothetical protein